MKWISVQDELPPLGQKVLVLTDRQIDEHGYREILITTDRIINPHSHKKIFEWCKCGAPLHCERERQDKEYYQFEHYKYAEYWMLYPELPEGIKDEVFL